MIELNSRLARIGARMRAVVIVLFLAAPVAFVATGLAAGWDSLLPVPPRMPVDLAGQSVAALGAVILLAALRPLVFMAALWLLQDLFALYGRGRVFDPLSVRRVRQIGWMLIGIDLAELVQRLLIGPVLSGIGATAPFVSIGFGASLSIVGGFVIVIAKVMELGRELQELEERTV
jgi:hypothetical protein